MTIHRNRRAGVEDRWRKSDGTPTSNAGRGKRWRARWVDDTEKEHARGFERKVDAQQFLDTVTTSHVMGTYVDPKRGAVTFASFYREWSSRQVWVPGTLRAMNLAADGVTFANVAMVELRTSHVETWVKAMQVHGLAPGTIKTRFNNVRSVLRAGLRDKVLAVDPSTGVSLPRRRRADAAMTVPTPKQVGTLTNTADSDFVAFVALAAFTGLRLGEAAALQVGDIDFLGRTIKIQRQVQRVNGGEVEIRLPKYGSEREIPAPDGLLEILAEHVRLFIGTLNQAAWLFPGKNGHPMHQNSVGYRWRKARKDAGVDDLKLHDLRHFYASGLIAAGCDVVTVQRALGE
ncbi:tyrosine-type recombinase/integrase [Rhodococcus erythropolis]|uniref:Site-specific integrase n=1 Tax=Rhodococcus erythropolis TaxID=1833 RepID=A0A8I1D6F9_RHOER|nr:site-specific integrase [Rhodococcus erythropolis]MBH5141438.1 site-specific integrase [Rhodococcus erythropolis]